MTDLDLDLAGITEGHTKPNVWFDPARNAWVYRASSVGNCSLQLQRFREGLEGEPPPEWMAKRFRDGHIHERSILAEIQRQRPGWTVHPDNGDSQYETELWLRQPSDDRPGVVIVGHIDGLAVNRMFNPDSRICEAKAFSKDNYEKAERALEMGKFWATYPYYRDQATIYMASLEVPMFFGIKNKNSGDVLVFDVDTPPYPVNKLAARILKIEDDTQSGVEYDDCDVNSWPCPFFKLPPHDDDGDDLDDDPEAIMAAAIADDLDELDKDGKAELERLCTEYIIARDAEKAASERKDELKRKIMEGYLEEGKVEEVKSSGHTVKLKRHTYRWLDEDSMLADGVEPDLYRRQNITHYPLVKEAKK